MLYDVPEKPLSIQGKDAIVLLERIFTRKISNLKVGRARYAIACTPQGQMLMDGIVIRLAADHFWYVKADGEFETWLLAYSESLDVVVSDPKSWVLQIQGPKALDVLAAAADHTVSDRFGYFHVDTFTLGGQEVLISRTGWTGETGFEVYSNPNIDHLALWDHLMASGKPFGMDIGSVESMGIRRIEAGILDKDFVGKAALAKADQRSRLFGLISETGIPGSGMSVLFGDMVVGRMTTGGWSPTLEKGIGYVRFDQHPDNPKGGTDTWLGETVSLQDREGTLHSCTVVALPFYDAEKRIPRGLGHSTN